MNTCDAWISPMSELPRKATIADWWCALTSTAGKGTSRRCGRPAIFRTRFGLRCQDCADKLVDAILDDNTILGMAAKAQGKRPRSRKEAQEAMLVPIQ